MVKELSKSLVMWLLLASALLIGSLVVARYMSMNGWFGETKQQVIQKYEKQQEVTSKVIEVAKEQAVVVETQQKVAEVVDTAITEQLNEVEVSKNKIAKVEVTRQVKLKAVKQKPVVVGKAIREDEVARIQISAIWAVYAVVSN